VNKDEKQFFTAFNNFSLPLTFKYVQYCPAKLAPGRSSAVAEVLTATSVSLSPYCLESWK